MLTAAEKLEPDASGLEVQKTLAAVAEQVAAGKFAYNKFFAIGLFRCALQSLQNDVWRSVVLSCDYDRTFV